MPLYHKFYVLFSQCFLFSLYVYYSGIVILITPFAFETGYQSVIGFNCFVGVFHDDVYRCNAIQGISKSWLLIEFLLPRLFVEIDCLLIFALAEFDAKKADSIMETALSEFSDNAGFLFETAQYYARKCEYEKAIDFYEQSWEKELDQKPRFTDALDGIATIYVIMNNTDKAIETYDRLIACLKSEWGYKDDDAAVIDVERKKKALRK